MRMATEKPEPPVPLAAALRRKLGLPRRTFSRLKGFSERVIAHCEMGNRQSHERAEPSPVA
jgi:hypothetical protein